MMTDYGPKVKIITFLHKIQRVTGILRFYSKFLLLEMICVSNKTKKREHFGVFFINANNLLDKVGDA